MKARRGGYDVRSVVRTTRKRCAKCGKAGWFKPRETRCKRLERNAFGRTGYWCYGRLERPVKQRQADDGDVLREAIQSMREIDPSVAVLADKSRAAARQKLTHAERMLKAAQTDVKRATTRMTKWQRMVSYHAKRASLTNHEFATKRTVTK